MLGMLLLVASAASAKEGSSIPFAGQSAAGPAHNTLSELERKQGFELLFDGRTTCGWRSARGPEFPKRAGRSRAASSACSRAGAARPAPRATSSPSGSSTRSS